MKKYLHTNQLVIIAVGLVTLIIAVVISLSCTMPMVSYAYSGDEIYYAALGNARKDTETFSYTTKKVESYSINPTFPNYYNKNGTLDNTCANVAGANIIGYYDRYFENLIPNIVPGIGTTSKYTYYPMTKNATEKQAVIDDLYKRMGTNSVGPGNSQTQYKNGLASYVQSKGHSIVFNSVITNSKFDLNKAKIQLQNGNPISLYMSGYGFTKITDNGATVLFDKFVYDDNHIAIAYGYEKVEYYGSNGSLLRSEIYLRVSTGINGITGVYIVNNYGKLNDAEAVNIK